MGEKISEILRAYVLPTVLVAVSFGSFGNVAIQAARAYSVREQPEQHEVIDHSGLSQRPEEFLEFLSSYECQIGQWEMDDESPEYQETPEFRAKAQEFFGMLRAGGYFPSPESVKRLEGLCDGRGYDLGMREGNDRVILAYRTKDAPSPFQRGFTLIEPGTNQSVKNMFGGSSLTSPDTFHYYLMDQQGMIEYLVTLNPEDCSVMKPHTLVFRTWVKGRPWEDLAFAQTQKRVSERLEEMANNPQSDLLNCVVRSPPVKGQGL